MDSISLNAVEEKKWYDLALILGIFTIVYNLTEGIIAIWFGFEDETLALFGFGVDSFIEMISGIGIVSMVLRIKRNPHSNRSEFERTALKITGYSFYALVLGLVISSILVIYLGKNQRQLFGA